MTIQYHEETKRFEVSKEEAKPKAKQYQPMFRVTGTQLEKLLKFAEADGFELTKKDKKGKDILDNFKVGNTVKIILHQILSDWIADREAR